MSARQSRSASTPIPAARNIEQVIPMSFTMPPAPMVASRPRLISNTRPLTHSTSDRGMMSTSVGRTNIVNSPAGSFPPGSYSSIVARPIVGNNNANHPPFEPRIIRATTSPTTTTPSDPTCFPSSPPPRVRRQSSTSRHPSTLSTPVVNVRSVPPPTNVIPSTGNASSLSTSQAFPRPTYLDHSAFRDLIRTNVSTTVQSADPPLAHVPNTITTTYAPYPYMGRMTSPSMDSDEDSTSTTPPPVRISHASSSKDVWRGKANFPLPTRWSEMDRHTSLAISSDGRDLRFCGPSCTGDRESAAARANEPIPPACGIYYYEVEILHKGGKGHISIGFSSADVKLTRLPGWEKHSWGYHADDGWSFPGHKDGNPYGPTFDTGDIIGCGIDFSQNKAFYTKNGNFLGLVFENVGNDLEVYPSIGLRHAEEAVRANFGQAPFKFAIEDYVHCARDQVWSGIQSVPANWTVLGGGIAQPENSFEQKKAVDEDVESKEALKRLVFDYLAHHGYLKTAHAFKAQCERRSATQIIQPTETAEADDMDTDEGPSSPSPPITGEEQGLRTRVHIMKAVLGGDIDEALTQTQTHYPSVLEREQGLMLFKLRCRKFIELILEASDALKKAKSSDDNPSTGDVGNQEIVRGREATKKGRPVASEQDEEIDETQMDDGGAMEVDDPSPEAHSHSSNSPSLEVSSSVTATTDETTHMVALDVNPISRSSSSSSTRSSSKAVAKAALDEALRYGQILDGDYRPDTRPEIKNHLRRTFGVVAYTDPLAAGGEVAEMAGQESRNKLATELNQAILESQGKPTHPALEMLYRQTAACVAELGSQGVGAAAFADMSREFLDA
ncbi:hypothetical protein QCA50_008664 [Cerrena zonata]|uniref:SPRY-domain-containing protein n=1 Tax=Cerrena zonata TaxID=2478898 RepID=A0AAW0GE26_9APHY